MFDKFSFADININVELIMTVNQGYNDSQNWFLSNKVLYDLCEMYPKHNDLHQIVAKIYLIGRSYAVAVERRTNAKETEEGNFYYDYIAPAIKNSDIDKRLERLKKFDYPTEENMEQILSVHKYLQEVIAQCTADEKRSLVSKYLHFHMPNLFYLYDSYSNNELNKIVKHKSKWNLPENADDEYAKYFIRSLFVQSQIAPEVSDFPRILDRFLQKRAGRMR